MTPHPDWLKRAPERLFDEPNGFVAWGCGEAGTSGTEAKIEGALMHILFFVIGASGAGKTTAVEALEERRPDIGFRYFDAIGVPSPQLTEEAYASGEEWQRQMTFAWVKRIKATALAEAPVVLDGQTRQSFIVDACSAAGLTRYKIILFHCRQAERERRLIARGHPELVNAKMESWANYLREQALMRGEAIIDTTDLNPQQALEALEGELATN